ncbi:MAG: alpha/beta hydrolase [Planctomycetes bacterium]|nr:alpha/beta hydrolase [Planctomycetota bacterium]
MTEEDGENEFADSPGVKKRRPPVVRLAISVARIVITAYIGLGAVLFFFQSSLLYRSSDEIRTTPAAYRLEYEDVSFAAEDSTRLSAWYVPGRPGADVVLFCHGNAGNISDRLDSLAIFNQMGLSVLIFDYRGYGRSEGKTTEEGTYQDARAAWDYLVNVRKIDPDRIIVFGRSLGGAVAAALAAERAPRALILESTFTSVADLAAGLYPYMPIRLLCRFSYDTLAIIGRIKCPILIVHSKDDEMIDISHGRRLFDAATGRKEFLELRGGHNDGIFTSATIYREGLSAFVEKVRKQQISATR